MDILDLLKRGFVLFDGGFGTELQKRGLKPGELPETWNVLHPEEVKAIHAAYFAAGSDVATTNTFGANRRRYTGRDGSMPLRDVVARAIDRAHAAAIDAERADGRKRYVSLDIGPTGLLMEPAGTLSLDDAAELFGEVAALGGEYGADSISVETMSDLREMRAAVLGAKENAKLPIFATVTFNKDGRLLSGAGADTVATVLGSLGVSALGANCGVGPNELKEVISTLREYCSVPVMAVPNAGLPKTENGRTVYPMGPDEFAAGAAALAQAGARVLGGCCGTGPEHIKALRRAIDGMTPLPVSECDKTLAASASVTVDFAARPVMIGERLNPTGKKTLREAIRNGDTGYIQQEAINQDRNGADMLDVNMGVPGIDEPAAMRAAIKAVSAVTQLPLQIDTSNTEAMEAGLREYCGRAMINSVNGKQENMDAVLPLVKKYGGIVVALTLDESGIPTTAEGRFAIAEKICAEAAKYGIPRKDIIVDPLCMAASADPSAPGTALEALSLIRDRLGCRTVLGVSNVSFGLPHRDTLNSAFLTLALEHGLGAAIMNPSSQMMRGALNSFLALTGRDPNFSSYIACVADAEDAPAAKPAGDTLADAVEKGLSSKAAQMTEKLLETKKPMEIIDGEIVPALDTVGRGFEEKKVFLPQLLMAANAARAAFDVIKERMARTGGQGEKKGLIVIATVKGDVHDIGKNIVKALLENYSYDVIDLGHDVAPETIVEKAKSLDCRLVGLSALMTTTVPAMEETVRLLHEQCPNCRVMVGGAVLTEDYAQKIGADYYAADAMAGIRIAGEVFDISA